MIYLVILNVRLRHVEVLFQDLNPQNARSKKKNNKRLNTKK